MWPTLLMSVQAPTIDPRRRNRHDAHRRAPDRFGNRRAGQAAGPLVPRRKPRVLMLTEGTYPYAVGGVSSWCDVVIGRLTQTEWDILPIVAGGRRCKQHYQLPANARLLRPIELWTQDAPPRRIRQRQIDRNISIPAQLLRGLIPWDGDRRTLIEALVECRRRPQQIRREFRSRDAWETYVRALQDVLEIPHKDSAPAPIYDAIEAARLYQLLYWVARTAAVPTPPCALLHVTAAGWAAIPALVHKALHGTPILLTEHGVYVREAYLASVRDTAASLGEKHMSTRLALGLTRAIYEAADVIAPVTEANAAWERALGVDGAKIRVIPNGIDPPGGLTDAPNAQRVVSVGRIDPLKDVQTLLLVASEVTRRLPRARFEHWGPPTAGEEAYASACERMHRQLGLGERFRFMGRTADPHAAIRNGDVLLMTSISEAMPMALLEAMAQGRPVVATSVGGVPGVVRGCGIITAPGDVHGLATAITTLLRNPVLARTLGRRGYDRLNRRYTRDQCLSTYAETIAELTGIVG
jgi:polysaccharide biosynthesis protein PelF